MRASSTDALVLVDKPAGVTSFDVVRAVARAVGAPRAGHTGTLDPFATGLLIVLTGRGTRLIRYVPGEPKVYRAVIAFGEERATDDRTGSVTRQAPLPDLSRLAAALPALTGEIMQVPPAYSAKKLGGRRAYALARAGERPELAPVRVRVDAWTVLETTGDTVTVRITCGAGTYIRALARDLGRSMDSAAHLAGLRRERSGPFEVTGANAWDDLHHGAVSTRDLRDALGSDVRREVLTPDEAVRVAHGMSVPARAEAERAALLGPEGALLAVARREDRSWRPEVVLADA